MSKGEKLLQPTFPEGLFRFEDPELIPPHYNAWPDVPNFVGTWAVFGWSGGDKTMNYAVDAISEEQAVLLAEAKKQYFEDSITLYGHTLDIYILNPNGQHTRHYVGRELRR